MSRSIRRRPFAPFCGGRSQKKDKRICNRIIRRNNRMLLLDQDTGGVVFIHKREALDVWCMPQDGSKHYQPFGGKRGNSRLEYMEWFRWVVAK